MEQADAAKQAPGRRCKSEPEPRNLKPHAGYRWKDLQSYNRDEAIHSLEAARKATEKGETAGIFGQLMSSQWRRRRDVWELFASQKFLIAFLGHRLNSKTLATPEMKECCLTLLHYSQVSLTRKNREQISENYGSASGSSKLTVGKKHFFKMNFPTKQKLSSNLFRISPDAVDANGGLANKVV